MPTRLEVRRDDEATYSGTRHLAMSIFGQGYRDAWMAMIVSGLTSYFDVSGDSKHEHHVYACAGFGAPVEKWVNKFEPVWRDVLDEVGIPEFHTTDVVARKKKGFRHITDEQYQYMLTVLFRLVKEHTDKSFARLIDGDDLAAIRASGDTPIRVAGVDIVKAVEQWRSNRRRRGQKTGPKERFKVVFDGGEKGIGALIESFPAGRQPLTGSSKDDLPLQAADWLAWELARLDAVHKRHRGHRGVKYVKVRGEVYAAIHELPRDWKYYDYANDRWIDIIMTRERARRLGI